MAAEDLILAPDARRYEAGSHNSMGIVGLHASLQLLQRIGIDNIARDLLAKRRLLVDELTQKKYRVMHADVEELHASGMVTFDRAGEDMRATHQRLKEKHIFTALRSDRDGRAYIRVSPHFYINDDLLGSSKHFRLRLPAILQYRASQGITGRKLFVCLMLTD